ncbi:MAG: hypothetical protein AB1512_27615 [Thermodesulfobacteriota bacterium]
MEIPRMPGFDRMESIHGRDPMSPPKPQDVGFQAILSASSSGVAFVQTQAGPGVQPSKTDLPLSALMTPALSRSDALAAYRKHAGPNPQSGRMSDLQKYKDDQLLIHPGGDDYDLERKEVGPRQEEQSSFWGRIGKDLSDAFSNAKNFFHDLLFGAKVHYRDQNGRIQEGKRRGLVGSVVDFFKDLGSALSFGAWRPDGEQEPQGFLRRVGFFFSKLKEAIFGDILQGVCGSVIHMAKDLLFAAWNTLEVLPDATIGNLEEGQKATSAVFDHGQVALDYLTDILPFGDAWLRVHSLNLKEGKAPVLHNIGREEHSTDDDRWRFVRNTPFRKTVETIGSLLFDILGLKLLGRTDLFSEERRGN